MSVFISYSHQNKDFVDTLARNLMIRNTRVWVDSWELKVGDSLVQRVQAEIQKAEALIVVLSKASVQSEWCKKELTAALVRELEEKHVVILPVLLEDCEVPLFVKDKLYADFRHDFDKGLAAVLDGIAAVTSRDTLGHLDSSTYNVDYAIDWGFTANLYWLRITLLEQAEEKTHSVITEILVRCNETATKRLTEYAVAGLEWFGRQVIILALDEFVTRVAGPHALVIPDSLPKTSRFGMGDRKRGIEYEVEVTSRRIGIDNGKDIYVDWGNQVHTVSQGLRKQADNVPPETAAKIRQIIERMK